MADGIVIALDAMGGDHAPEMVVRGAHIALKRFPNVHFLLFGACALTGLGFVLHFANGLGFAVVYGLVFAALGRSEWWLGAGLGLLHGVFALVVVLPVLQGFHPRMALEDEGPDPTPMLEPPGFLALNYGYQTPLVTVVAHVLYGSIVGLLYPPLG